MKVLCVAFYAMKVAGQSGSCSGTGACSIDGSSTTYTETISGTVRQIRSSGCPNNNPVDVCVGANPNPANTQDWQFDIPATPQFNSATYEASLTGALSLQELGGIIGITRNGILDAIIIDDKHFARESSSRHICRCNTDGSSRSSRHRRSRRSRRRRRGRSRNRRSSSSSSMGW